MMHAKWHNMLGGIKTDMMCPCVPVPLAMYHGCLGTPPLPPLPGKMNSESSHQSFSLKGLLQLQSAKSMDVMGWVHALFTLAQ